MLPSAIERYEKEVHRILRVLNTALRGRIWLVGDKCTFADLAFLPWNTRLDATLLTAKEKDPLEQYPNVKAWHKRMLVRDSWKRTMVIRDKLMDDQGLQPNGMPKGVNNMAEYETFIKNQEADKGLARRG